MIREAEQFDTGTLRAPFSPGPISARVVGAAPASVDGESAEQEITRLTWSVLDGSASLTDRQRLAELVKVQHAARRRIDR